MPSTSTDTDVATATTARIRAEVLEALRAVGVDADRLQGDVPTRSPITGDTLLYTADDDGVRIAASIEAAADAFRTWREVPAPVRGALVKRWGELLREHKRDLAALITAEVGKTRSEALGEVQEMIDIADLAVGQSRQLYGRTMPSERPGHRLAETWHPLGVVAVISAFNFPVAVYAWNAALALMISDDAYIQQAQISEGYVQNVLAEMRNGATVFSPAPDFSIVSPPS